MTLKGTGGGPLPPLLQQYVELRDAHAGYVLLFQVGDFYEVFGEEAERLSAVLSLHLTHKSSKDFVTPMAGIPLRALEGYLERLLRQGYRVAIADQVEPAEAAEGLVRREVTQLITPGTLLQENLLRPEANYLAALATGDGYGLALLEVSTGDFRGTVLYSRSALYDEIIRYHPSEVLLAGELQANTAFLEEFQKRFPVLLSQGVFDSEAATAELHQQLGQLPANPALLRAAGAVLAYARTTQRGQLPQVDRFVTYDPGAYMQLSEATVRTLEIHQPSPVSQEGEGPTLVDVLGYTRTAPGRRLLLDWFRHPLIEAGPIEARLDAVEALVQGGVLRDQLRKWLYRIHDLERLSVRLSLGRGHARDLMALARSLELLPQLRQSLESVEALRLLAQRLPSLVWLAERIATALVPEPPLKLADGPMLRQGFDPTLDQLRQQAAEGRAWIAALEASERQSTQIPTLKVAYNQVFGYYLEVTRPYYTQVPPSWAPIQTLKDRQRYTRADLRDKEREVLQADESARRREWAVFAELRQEVAQHAEALRRAAQLLAEVDVYAALAEAAVRQGYVRPRFAPDQVRVVAGRHPVVERQANFIPNDLHMDRHSRLWVLTGPNMAGKSTYLRQTALIALMAQVGSFVPAESATLPLFDRIFTRIGAADDIAGGRSTFMVEMEELATILHQATPRSLVLLDEVGRGTSTYDGLSVAWAAAEHLHHHNQSYTLFATHYFELTALVHSLPAARNAHVAAREEANGLVFYHQVMPGPASRSYGLEVARLAGLPMAAVQRARQVLSGLEARQGELTRQVIDELLALDLSSLNPLQALLRLTELQRLAQGEVWWQPAGEERP